jgi:hypothetical protein
MSGERLIDITISTEDLWNGVQMTIIYITIPTEDLLNGVYRTIIYITILTEDSRDLDVSGNIITIKQKLRKYFPDENIATDKTSVFDCVVECFTKTNYFIYDKNRYITIPTEDL